MQSCETKLGCPAVRKTLLQSRLRGLLGGVFFGPLLLLLFDVLWRRRKTFEGVFDVAVSSLPNLVGVRMINLHICQHAPGKIARGGINKVNAERAHVRRGGFDRVVDETPVVSVVWAVDAPVCIRANIDAFLAFHE